MRFNFRIKHNKEYDIDLVDMKCLECNHEEEADLDILLELFDPDRDPAPVLTCPCCNHDLLVPKDVFDQIKGNFIYKVEK